MRSIFDDRAHTVALTTFSYTRGTDTAQQKTVRDSPETSEAFGWVTGPSCLASVQIENSAVSHANDGFRRLQTHVEIPAMSGSRDKPGFPAERSPTLQHC